MSVVLQNLEKLLGTSSENKLLHYSLGSEYLKLEQFDKAEIHLVKALSMDAEYSAAWKMLGKTLNAAGKYQQAVDAFDQGIEVAEKRGDIQAAKEMKVFRKRAEKAADLAGE